MNIVERAKGMVISPKTEWLAVEAESSTVKSIYLEYLVILAAIPAIAGFIGLSLLGYSMFGVTVRVPILAGVSNMIVGYALSLGLVYVLALIADALAPTFQGQKNFLNAFKLIAFSMTAGLLGGVFSILPALSVLGLLASLYGIYILYLGAPGLMKVPQDKAIPYTVVLLICGIVAGVLIGIVTSALTSSPIRPGMSLNTPGIDGSAATAPAAISIDTPSGKVELNTQNMDAMNQKLEAISKQAESAAQQGDAKASMEAAAKALQAISEAMSQPAAAK